MSNKLKRMQFTKLYILCNLLLENLDEIKVTEKEITKFKHDLTAFCELMNETSKDNLVVLKSTYFQSMSNKINTIIRKDFEEDF